MSAHSRRVAPFGANAGITARARPRRQIACTWTGAPPGRRIGCAGSGARRGPLSPRPSPATQCACRPRALPWRWRRRSWSLCAWGGSWRESPRRGAMKGDRWAAPAKRTAALCITRIAGGRQPSTDKIVERIAAGRPRGRAPGRVTERDDANAHPGDLGDHRCLCMHERPGVAGNSPACAAGSDARRLARIDLHASSRSMIAARGTRYAVRQRRPGRRRRHRGQNSRMKCEKIVSAGLARCPPRDRPHLAEGPVRPPGPRSAAAAVLLPPLAYRPRRSCRIGARGAGRVGGLRLCRR